MATGYESRYGLFPPTTLEPLPVLAQAFSADEFKNIPDKLNTTTVPQVNRGLGGSVQAYDKVSDDYLQYADRSPAAGLGGGRQIQGYTIPTDKTFNGLKLAAKYDDKGNFEYLSFAEGNYLTPDPNQPNIASSPRFNKTGGIIDYGVFDLSKQEDGGFFSMVRELGTEFAPMILTALGANYLAGSGLFSPSVAPAVAPAVTGSGANFMSPALISSAGNAGTAAATATGGGLLNSGVNATGGANFMSPSLISSAGGAGATVTPSMLQSIANATGISVDTLKNFAPSVIQGLIGAGSSYLTSEQAKEAAQTQADAQVRAAQIAADAARFRPVGVTTRFGSSNFKTDAAGNVIEAGYTPSPEILGYQNRLSTLANRGLTGAEQASTDYAPLTGAAQNLFSLGGSYIKKSPEEVAADYISKQQALIAPSRELQLSNIRNIQQQQGRGGLSVAQGGNLMATNPELAAYYNSVAQGDLVLAAQADQEAQNRIRFGAGLFDTGANLQGRYYTGQTAALAPFTNVMDVTTGLENLAQQPMTLGTQIGAKTTAGAAQAGMLTSQGITSAAQTMAPANAYSLGGNVLAGFAGSPNFTGALNRAFGVTTDQATINQQLIDILLNRKQSFVA